MTFWRRLWVRERPDFSKGWWRDLARRGNRIEFHGSGEPWRFDRIEMDASWRNRFALRNEVKQQQERKRA